MNETINDIDEVKEDENLSQKEKNIEILRIFNKINRNNSIKLAQINEDINVYDRIKAMVVFNSIKSPLQIKKEFK